MKDRQGGRETMRDELKKIMQISVNIYRDGFDGTWEHEIRESGLNDLTALMCYREVRAFCFGYEGDIHHISDSILKVFEKDYSEYDIKRAIEKVKNDQK